MTINTVVAVDDIKGWTGLSSHDMWKEPENRVAWRKCVNLVAPNGLNRLEVKKSRLHHNTYIHHRLKLFTKTDKINNSCTNKNNLLYM